MSDKAKTISDYDSNVLGEAQWFCIASSGNFGFRFGPFDGPTLGKIMSEANARNIPMLYTARNLRADPETQALGEDEFYLAHLLDQFNVFRNSIEIASNYVHSTDGRIVVAALNDALNSVAVDLMSTADAAKEAKREAVVVPIKRPGAPALRVVK